MERRELLAAGIDAFVVPTVADQGQAVAMSAQASSTLSGAALTYTWNFGDGNQQSGVNLTDVTHVYTAPSPSNTPYVVTLTVDDGDQPASATADLAINDVPPTISAGPSQTVRAGSTVQFNGSASDAGGSSQIASIQWDFNYDGSNFNPDTSANGNLTPSHTYTTPGTYTVALQVTDQNGGVSQDFTTVIVKPANALLVNAGPDITVTAGQNVTLSGSYDDPSGTVNSSGIAWDTNYNGQTFNPVVTGTLTPTVSFATPGNYQVALQITDSNGTRDISVLNVTVNPISYTGPTAAAGSDQTINEGGTASFNGSYTDPDGTVSSSGIAWDFNYDGVSFNPMATGTLTPSYQFTTPGDYTVALQVTDSNGLTSLSTLTVTVNAVPPAVNAGSDMTVTAGQLVQFNGSASIPSGANDSLDYAWDFNYDGQNFNPGSANSLTPYSVFTTAGTYTVALQATDNEGVSSLSTLTVTVNPSNSLVVNAGPDQAINEGDTAVFNASYTDGSGTVDPSTAQWDFNYDGQNFVADPNANGTLTPSHQFTAPGNYLVAVQLTDSNNVTSLGVMYVSVAGVPPVVDAGPDQTVNQGDTVQFNGTASVPSGVSTTLSYAWDFDYDGQNFVADPNTPNTLTPTHVFSTPGTYEVALQVTDGFGQTSLATLTVTVNDVPPAATVSGPGTVNAGSPATFTIANLQDQTPGDTPTLLADWEGTGQFEEITPDEITTNSDGSLSFTHVYDVPGNYNAVIEILDGSGGSTDYTTNVVVNDVAPTADYFGPNATYTLIDASVPIYFNSVTDPSLADTLAGFTYYVSLDSGAYSSSNSPVYYLPAGISQGSHTLTGYIEDSYGLSSPIYSTTVDVESPQLSLYNNSSGQIELNWSGASQPVVVEPYSEYVFQGSTPNLTITLLTSETEYEISLNNSVAVVNAAAGVTNVTLLLQTVDSDILVGNGDIGEIDLPADSTLIVNARGDVGNIVGAPGSSASQLTFTNLTGSITGLDSIGTLEAWGWLGTNSSQVVDVAAGIGSLSAYGVGATVEADQNQNAGDPAMSVSVGDGGVPGEIDAGNVSSMEIAGNVNRLSINNLEGEETVRGKIDKDTISDANAEAYIKMQNDVGELIFNGNSPQTIPEISVKGSIDILQVKSGLNVQDDQENPGYIKADKIGSIQVSAGNLSASYIEATQGIGAIKVAEGDLTLKGDSKHAGVIDASKGNIKTLNVKGNLTGQIKEQTGAVTDSFTVGGNFSGGVSVLQTGATPDLTVKGNFTSTGGNDVPLLSGPTISNLSVSGTLGGNKDALAGKIKGDKIDNIYAKGDILLSTIETTKPGNIESIITGGKLKAAVTAIAGNVVYVKAKQVAGNITARVSTEAGADATASGGGNIFVVVSTDPIPKTVTFTAAWYIYTIKVTKDPGTVPETFTVKAQGGTIRAGMGDRFQAQGPLIIDVGAGSYLGKVAIQASTAKGIPPAQYRREATLLTIIETQNNQQTTTSWTIAGNNQNPTTVNAVFQKLTDGSFGWVKNKKALSNEVLTIQGPSGDAAN